VNVIFFAHVATEGVKFAYQYRSISIGLVITHQSLLGCIGLWRWHLLFSKRQLWTLLLALDRAPAVYAVQMKDESCTRVTPRPELTGADFTLLRADPALVFRKLVYHPIYRLTIWCGAVYQLLCSQKRSYTVYASQLTTPLPYIMHPTKIDKKRESTANVTDSVAQLQCSNKRTKLHFTAVITQMKVLWMK
jgi:hypothetical protein